MASAKNGYPKVVELFEEELATRGELPQTERDQIFDKFEATLDEQLRAYVVKVDRLTPTIVDVIVKARFRRENSSRDNFIVCKILKRARRWLTENA